MKLCSVQWLPKFPIFKNFCRMHYYDFYHESGNSANENLCKCENKLIFLKGVFRNISEHISIFLVKKLIMYLNNCTIKWINWKSLFCFAFSQHFHAHLKVHESESSAIENLYKFEKNLIFSKMYFLISQNKHILIFQVFS